MGLDPECAAIVEQFSGGPAFEDLTVEQCRELTMGYLPLMGPPEDVDSVEDGTLDGDGEVAVRIYTPEQGEQRPAVVYLHGGGWATGNIELTDPLCRIFANRTGCTIVSVDYCLAPEHPYPAALEDAYATVAWLARDGAEIGVDPDRLAIMGDSSGGGLATGVTLLARERGGPRLAMQVLVYPATAGYEPDTASYREYGGGGYIVSAAGLEMFWNHYTGGGEPDDGALSAPLRVGDLTGLPPAFVLTAECDPLRDEGDAYARRLREAGVPVEHVTYPGTMHGFIYMPAVVAKARQAIDEVAGALRSELSP